MAAARVRPGGDLWKEYEPLFRQAAAYRDWGDAGKDDIFGEGGIYLHPYAPDTALLSPDYTDWVSFLDLFGGWSGSTMQGPFLRVSDAMTYVPTGGRLLFLSGEFPEMVTVTKAVEMVSVPADSRIGD